MTKRKGFTLIEIMIVIVIVGIMIGMAIPMLNSSQAKYNNVVNNLIDKLNMARQEAITKNITTTFYIDADSFLYGSDKVIYDSRIDVTVNQEISFDNPILFNAGGSTPKLVIFEINGFERMTRIYLMPSGYILKSNETE